MLVIPFFWMYTKGLFGWPSQCESNGMFHITQVKMVSFVQRDCKRMKSDAINWTNTEPTPPITAGRTNENPERETRLQVKRSPQNIKRPIKRRTLLYKDWNTGSIDKRSKRGAMPELSWFMANMLRKVMSASAASHFPQLVLKFVTCSIEEPW